MALPDAERGAARLAAGAWFAVAGDPIARRVVDDLGGRWFEVADGDRAAYHAAAASPRTTSSRSSARSSGWRARSACRSRPTWTWRAGTLDNVAALGPAAALTGPVARGDWATVAPPPRGARPGRATRLPMPSPRPPGAWWTPTACPTTSPRKGGRCEIHETIAAFRAALDEARRRRRPPSACVPTMGYLHDGHVSLMRRAVGRATTWSAASIFVNPLQFAANEDLGAYPRDLDRDVALATERGVDPRARARASPRCTPSRCCTDGVGRRDHRSGSRGRPGPTHFAGVATVVAKLFAIAGPCRAYFGEKDFQQLAVVRRMAADLSLPVEVVGCPTVRERRRPRHVEPQRVPDGRGAGGGAGAPPGARAGAAGW